MVQLILDDHGALEISQETRIPLNYDINDIRILGSRNGAWSKTIKLPGTATNNRVLGNVFNINLATFDFDPLKKAKVREVVDGVTVFEGIFQLRKINKKWRDNGDFDIVYDCHVKNDASDLFSVLSGKDLKELNLSRYDHIFTEAEMIDSLENGNWTRGYQYFLGYQEYDTQYWGRNLIPGMYARTYLDQIFSEAGYNYEFPEADEINFNNLMIPFNGEVYAPAIDRKWLFKAGSTQEQLYNLYQNFGNGFGTNFPSYSNTVPADQPLRYDDTQSPGLNFVDPNGLYDTVLHRYDVSGFAGTMDFTFRVRGQIGVTVSGGVPETTQLIGSVSLNPRVKVKAYSAFGILLGELGDIDLSDSIDPQDLIIDGQDVGPLAFTTFNPLREIDAQGSGTFSSLLFNGNAAYIQIELQSVVFGQSNFLGAFGPSSQAPGGGGHLTTFQLKQFPSINTNDNVVFNTPSSEIAEGTEIYASTVVPKDYKQSEFLLDMAKMHNLYIYYDQADSKRIEIKTRDRFYADGESLDWNGKIDLTTVDIEFLSNTQKKIKRLTYADDSDDVLLEAYKEQTRESYGQLRYVFENEFTRDTDDMETKLSPTVTIWANGLYLPYIDSQKPDNNVRVLQVGDLMKGNWEYVKPVLTFTPAGTPVVEPIATQYTQYRHTGMTWPTPIDPKLDISFGTPQYFAYPIERMTNANLYNRFYRNQLQILERGKILKAKFNLTASDIATLKFNERIWLLESWWNINRIIDWDATQPGLTQVELVSADSGLPQFIPGQFTIESKNAQNFYAKAAKGGKDKNAYGPGVGEVEIFGKSNLIHPQTGNAIVIGDKNILSGKNSIIIGDSNQVSGKNVAVLGVDMGKFDESNRVYLATPVVVSNFIQAGRDEVLSAFPDAKVVNYVSASRDEVRELGSQSMESAILAGRNTV